MLNTDALEEKRKALIYPHGVRNRAEYARLREEYRAAEKALEAEWELWLAHEYLPAGTSQKAAEAVYRYAWQEGHSSGYNSVENVYLDVAALIKIVLKG